jgi:hypothetical protein
MKIFKIISIVEACLLLFLGSLFLSLSAEKPGELGTLVGRERAHIRDNIIYFSGKAHITYHDDKTYNIFYENYENSTTKSIKVDQEELEEICKRISKLLPKYEVVLVKHDYIYTEDGESHYLNASWQFKTENRTYRCDIIENEKFMKELEEIFDEYKETY